MDWYPLYNSLRIAAISTVAVFFLGILAAYYIAKLPRLVKGVLDVVLTLPLLRMELDKDNWQAVPDKDRLTVSVPPEAILLLES